jgi:hypothetical protein
MDVRGLKLREGMARDDDAVEGILSPCCGREAMSVLGGHPYALHSAVAATLIGEC